MHEPVEAYQVYVRANDQNMIVEVNSSAFLCDTTGWTALKERRNGKIVDAIDRGDKYRHAQGNYFAKSLMGDDGRWNYKLDDGLAVERTDKEKAKDMVDAAVDKSEALGDEISKATTLEELKAALTGKNGIAKARAKKVRAEK